MRKPMERIELILNAISFAARKHDGQTRKDKKTPYVVHPLRVAMILSQLFGVKDGRILAAAVLHDTIEDTATDFNDLEKTFGRDVAVWVGFLSKDKRKKEKEREEEYLKTLADAPDEVKLVKLADVYDNLMDAPTANDSKHLEKTRMKAGKYLRVLCKSESKVITLAIGYIKAVIGKRDKLGL